MSIIDSIFVYGTLKQHHLRASMWPCTPLSIQPAFILAALYDTGPYPAILAGGDWVLGELWKLEVDDMPETLSVLDRVEGYDEARESNLYARIVIDVTIPEGEIVQAYTYQFASVDPGISLRRIAPTYLYAGRHCAVWPDAQSRVPKSLAEE